MERGGPANLTVELLAGGLPDAIDAAACAMATNPYACLEETRAFAPDLVPSLRHLVVRDGTQVAAVLSYHVRGAAAIAVNQCVAIDAATLAEAAARIFAAHPDVRRFELTNVAAAPGGFARLPWPTRVIDRHVENYVLELPATVEDFAAGFRARTRQRLRNSERRLADLVPALTVRHFAPPDVPATVVEAIVRLNHARMAAKGGQSLIGEASTEGLIRLGAACGAVCALMDGDRVLAGAVCTKVGRGWTLHVIAHDDAYSHQSIGRLCLVRTIEAAIRDGAQVFNFLWGRYDYKARLGARAVPLVDCRVYRSAATYVADLPVMFPHYAESVRRGVQRIRNRLHLGRFLPRRGSRPPVEPPDDADDDS